MPRLPPVDISPQMRLRARLCPGKICSVVTLFQSQSSSSATSCARPVSVPCPISERAMRITTVSSVLIATHALSSGAPADAPCASTTAGMARKLKPSAKPPPAAAVLTTKSRRAGFWMVFWRAGFVISFMSGLRLNHSMFVGHNFGSSGGIARGRVDRRADALIRAATADIRHRCINLRIGGLGCFRQ